MDLVEQIGLYMGIGAFLGLSVLALLYFSQARDVRRLRDWAGRAPERTTTALEQASEGYARQIESRRERARSGLLGPVPLLAAAGGLLALIAISVLLVANTGGGDSDEAQQGGQRSERGQRGEPAPVVPDNVQVAVLNGTSVPGLAAQIGSDVEAAGFRLGTVTNSESLSATTLVSYRRGRKREGEAVADALGILEIELMGGDTLALVGDADVAVIVGQNRAE